MRKDLIYPSSTYFVTDFNFFFRKNVSRVLNADSRWQHIAFYPGLPHIIKFQKETKHSPFTRNSTIRPNYLLEYMDSSHINQSYFTWHTLTNELKSSLVLELKVALPSLWQSTSGTMANQGTRRVEKRKIFRQWDVRHATQHYAGCKKKWRRLIHDYVSAAVTTISLHRFIIFPAFYPLAFAFILHFVRKTLLKEKDSICRRSVC